ncbi:MAG TPA: hypothetical protein VEL28_14655 [Candidatus Binatia bacterium]|nr:hypothetical protein [Candidatus Binatia bacterium]
MAVSQTAPPRRRTARVAGRPRFVAVLAAAALLAVAYDVWLLASTGSLEGLRIHWLGIEVSGAAAAALAAVRMLVHGAGAWGLWRLRAWARMGGMIYLGALLASMLFLWRPSGYGAGSAAAALLLQVSMIPLCTFCLMYLYRGARDFGAPPDHGTRGR